MSPKFSADYFLRKEKEAKQLGLHGKPKGKINIWKENTNGRWVLTTTNGTIEPQEAFYVDKDFTTENNNGGISFTYLPE